MKRHAWSGISLAVALGLCAPAAHAGSLARPNVFSALGIGIGGAGFAGVPNPTTIHYNPAGMTLVRQTVALGGLELVAAPRSYQPLSGPVEETEFALLPVPSLGVTTRLAHAGGKGALPVAFGLAFYNSFGGEISFDEKKVQPGITHSSIIMLELVPSVAYEINSKLSVGVGLRIGFGTFALTNTERDGVKLAPSDLSGSGVKAGFSAGVTFTPLSWLRLGLVYGSPMTVDMSGEGTVELQQGAPARPDNVGLTMPWPQWAAIGAALQLDPLTVYLGARWMDWSSFNRLVVDLSVITDVIEEIDFTDGYSLHLGAEWKVLDRLTLRAGFAHDSNTVPDKSVERQYLDAPKYTASLGCSLVLWKPLAVDLAYEMLFGPEREVPDVVKTGQDASGNPTEIHVNAAPGRYSSTVHSVGLSVRYSY